MRTERLILALIVITVSLSGFIAWNLLGPGAEREEFGFYKAQIQQDREMLQELQTSSVVERRIPASPISPGRAVSATVSSKAGRVQYYDPEDGQVYAVDYNGSNRETISPTKLSGFIRTIWSATKTEVVSEFATARGTGYRYFSYITKKTTSLMSSITSVDFSPEGDRIVYFYRTPDDAGVVLAQPDGSAAKKILNTRVQEMSVEWIDETTIALIRPDPLSSAQELYLLSVEGKLTKLLELSEGLEVRWSDDGTRALVSYFDQSDKLRLAELSRSTGALREVNAEARASGCALTRNMHYAICAISQTPLSTTAIETQVKTPEDFYEIDLRSGEKKLLFSSGSRSARASISEIFLSSNEEYVFYINRFDEKLYSFKR